LARLVHSYGRELRILHVSVVIEILTLQTYKRWWSREAGQIMLIKYAFNLGVEERRVATLILQFDYNVASELVVLREHRYHWDLKKISCPA
jgi:hypothetical protein